MSQYIDSQLSAGGSQQINEAIPDSLFVDDTPSFPAQALLSWPASGTTRKRSPPPPSEEPPVKRTAPKRMTWTSEKTATMISWFLECHRKGMFRSAKTKSYRSAWELVAGLAKERWPEYAEYLTEKVVTNKYDTERKRFREWKGWVSKSGVTFDTVDGRCEINEADDNWIEYCSMRGVKHCGWLASGYPLGNVEEYQELWQKDRAKGDYIERAGGEGEDGSAEGSRLQLALDIFNGVEGASEGEEGREGEEERESFFVRPLVNSSGPQRVLPGTPVRPAGRKITAEQWHRRVTDPDQAFAAAAEVEGVDVTRGRRRETSSDQPSSASRPSASPARSLFEPPPEESLAGAVRELAKSLARPNLVSEAIKDFSTRCKEDFKDDRKSFFAIIKLLREKDEATTWISLDEESREMYLEELKSRIPA